jgi:hypothetical protein
MTPQQFNDWRVIPRVLVISYLVFFAGAWVWVVRWFMGYDFTVIENEAVALALVAFPGAVLAVLTTVFGTLMNNYFRTGGTNGGNGG